MRSGFVVLLIFLSVAARASVTVTASVDREQVGEGDAVEFRIDVLSSDAKALGEPILPDLDGFSLINASQSQVTQSLFENGKFTVRHTRAFSYILSPQRTGDLVIGPASISVGGVEYKTQPLRLKVLAGTQPVQPRSRGGARPDNEAGGVDAIDDIFNQMLRRDSVPGYRSPPAHPNEAFFIQVEVDKTDAYVGEQITASWYLYTRGHIADIDTLKYPLLKGFWKEEIELATRLNFVRENVNGVDYNKALLTSYGLFALRDGTSLIDPYTAKCRVVTSSAFGFGKTYDYTKTSREIKIRVKELPVSGRPASFTGGVGQFEVTADYDRSTVAVGQPVTLKIRVEGRGHPRFVDLPTVALPQGVELYDMREESKWLRTGNGFKEFRLMVVPRTPGVVQLPEIKLGFFEPAEGRYYERTVPGQTLTATASEGQTMNAKPLSMPGARGLGPSTTVGPTLPAMRVFTADGTVAPRWLRSLWFWPGVYAVAALIFAFWARWRLRIVSLEKELQTRLRARVRKMYDLARVSNVRAVGIEGTNTVFQLMGVVSGVGSGSLDLARMLQKISPTIRQELGPDIERLFAEFQTLGFAPEQTLTSMREPRALREKVARLEVILSRAIALMDPLEKERT